MLRLVKNIALLIVTMSAFSLMTGCGAGGRNTPRPEVDACMIISQDNAAFCINNMSGREYDIAIEAMNKYTCFSPDHYGVLLIYIRLLQRYTPRKVDRKLQSFDWMNYNHKVRLNGLSTNR